jgi:aspartate carbamoyltransferase catalytic subunit
MESIEHNVGDFADDDRKVFEKVLGHKLQENQRVIIQVMDVDASKTNGNGSRNHPSGTSLDDWAIFRDLSDEEVAELESVILERSSGRDIDI